MTAAGPWMPVGKKPPVHTQVLVRLRGGAGFTADVACYTGRTPEGEERWILADVRLESRQITHWAELFDVTHEAHTAEA